MQRQRPDIESSVSQQMLLACAVSLILLLFATPERERERAVNDDVFGSDVNNFDFASGDGMEAQLSRCYTLHFFHLLHSVFRQLKKLCFPQKNYKSLCF